MLQRPSLPYKFGPMEQPELTERAFDHDFNRALGIRFAPARKRYGLYLILFFDRELRKIRLQTGDPVLRSIKMQFWREALDDPDGAGTELAGSLIRTFSAIPFMIDGLRELVSAHEVLMNEGESFEATGRRQAVLFQLALVFLNRSGRSPDHQLLEASGRAYGGALVLCGRSSGHEPDRQESHLIDSTRTALRAAQECLSDLAPQTRAALLQIALISPYLHLYETSRREPGCPIDLHPVKKVWLYWRAVRRGFQGGDT